VKLNREFEEVIDLQPKSGSYTFTVLTILSEPSAEVGGVLIYYVPSGRGKAGGGLYAAFLDKRKVVRYTSSEFFEELRDRGFVNVPWAEFEWGSVRGVRYMCLKYRVVYDSGFFLKLREVLPVDERSGWDQRLALLLFFRFWLAAST
ncbi:MAG: hypothetical protein ACP5J3_14220, partial [Pyrobaculum sp.]